MDTFWILKYKKSVIYAFISMHIAFISCKHTGSRPIDIDVKQTANTESSLKWVDYHIGELPPLNYYQGFDSVIKKWGIRYQRIDGGCEEILEERQRYEKDNPKYFLILEKKFGKGWRQRFFTEVRRLDSTLQNQHKN